MIFWPVALLAVTLPFTGRPPLFSLGALAFDLPTTVACLAVLAGLARAFVRNPRLDAFDWAAVALAACWVLSALATPAGTAVPLAAAWRRALGPILFVLVRRGMDGEERRFVAGLAFAAAVAALALSPRNPAMTADHALHLAICSAMFLPLARKRRRLALTAATAVALGMLAFALLAGPRLSYALPWGRLLLGWGPGSHPELALLPALPAETGLVGVLAALVCIWFGLRTMRAMGRRHPRPPEAFGALLVTVIFINASAALNPLGSLTGALGIWLALGILLHAKSPK